MIPSIEQMRAAGALSALDAQLALGLSALTGSADPLVALATAVASRRTQEGNVCADLRALASTPIVNDAGEACADWRYPEISEWLAVLRASELVTDGSSVAPLVLDPVGRLYLRRFWNYEQELARQLASRIEAIAAIPRDDHPQLRSAVDRLFGTARSGETDWQRVAAMVAVLRPLCVISGGPGTGKTSTVVRILALLLEALAHRHKRPLRPLLLAPTGKAAARLGSAVEKALSGLPCADDIKRLIPTTASTLHRALGPLPGTITRFRHHRDNPLPADIVVVDEASMVDVAMMNRLVSATPKSARLILLGDADQLASVEAGAVLSDLAGAQAPNELDAGLLRELEEVFAYRVPLDPAATATEPAGSVVHLTHSYRFGTDTALGRLASAIRQGDGDAVLELLQSQDDLNWCPEPVPNERLQARILTGYRRVLDASTAADALDQLERFRVLCAHRQGPAGVEQLNKLVERTLSDAALTRPGPGWLRGRAILITKNDYRLGVFNGDVALIWPDTTGTLRAFLRGADGTRALGLSRLPAHETAFCMTVHKSQGSEFDEVVVVLPEEGSPLLCRELLYTAVTRARSACHLFGSERAIRAAVTTRVQRNTGLRDAWVRAQNAMARG